MRFPINGPNATPIIKDRRKDTHGLLTTGMSSTVEITVVRVTPPPKLRRVFRNPNSIYGIFTTFYYF